VSDDVTGLRLESLERAYTTRRVQNLYPGCCLARSRGFRLDLPTHFLTEPVEILDLPL